MSARKGNKNALKNKWCIIKGVSEDGKVQYQVSDDVIDMRTISYDFDTFEDAVDRLKKIKLAILNGDDHASV
jgi:hypothetical protein|tara:strand:- start:1006 stop:1221 length:216 start_codon:yes stop_codon:yes gene_type:complete